jgi:hypothetical protein
MNKNKSNHFVANQGLPSPGRRLWNIAIRLSSPMLASTVGRLFWALKFTWLGLGVRVDSLRRVKLGGGGISG